MIFGYTLADTADDDAFNNAVEFITTVLKYDPVEQCLFDVDGSLFQKFRSGDDLIELESNVQINYVGIKSGIKLPIQCLHTWEA